MLTEQFGSVIEYKDAIGNLRHYEPDFDVAVTTGVVASYPGCGNSAPLSAQLTRHLAQWAECLVHFLRICW
jgi:hypothetical protein